MLRSSIQPNLFVLRFDDMQLELYTLTEIPVQHQMVLFGSFSLLYLIESKKQLSQYPSTTESLPFFLFNIKHMDLLPIEEPNIGECRKIEKM